MSIRPEHELHTRRKSRNVGVGMLLASFVIIVMMLTFTKVSQGDFNLPTGEEVQR